MKKILISLCLATGFTLSNIISFEYVCETDEHWPFFFGFPFVQSTDTTWVNSMSGIIYVKGLVGNILFWSLLFYAIIYLLNYIKHKIFRITSKVIIVILCAISLLIIYSEIMIFDWRIKWDHDNFKMNYYERELDCKCTFKIFN